MQFCPSKPRYGPKFRRLRPPGPPICNRAPTVGNYPLIRCCWPILEVFLLLPGSVCPFVHPHPEYRIRYLNPPTLGGFLFPTQARSILAGQRKSSQGTALSKWQHSTGNLPDDVNLVYILNTAPGSWYKRSTPGADISARSPERLILSRLAYAASFA
jgi:hypothetical protein